MSALPLQANARRPERPNESPSPTLKVGGLAETSFAGLEALRAWSAVAVVTLHACVAYADRPMPGLAWSTLDHSSRPVSVLMWSIEVVIMPIFLVMAGFLAARSFARGGRWHTFRSRLGRLGKPLLLAMIFVLPLDLYAWLLGWVADGVVGAAKLRSLKLDGLIDRHLWGTSHLWFLQYLITYIALLALVWRQEVPAERASVATNRKAASWMLWGTGAVAVVILIVHPEVVWGFQHSFWPVLTKWVYSGAFFVAGVLLWRSDPHLLTSAARSQRRVALGTLCLAAAVALGLWHLDQATVTENAADVQFGGARLLQTAGLPRWTLAILTVAAAWTVTVGLLGTCQRWVGTPSRLTSRLAESSLWIYLLHHPLVGLSHVSFKHAVWQLPVAVKLMGAVAVGVGVPLVVHQLLLGRLRVVASASEADLAEGSGSETRPAILLAAERPEEPLRRAG